MAISTIRTFLMKKTSASGTWEKVVDIKSFPNLGGAPNMLETTTLSDSAQTFIPGVRKVDTMEFKVNYTLADYKTLVALADVENQYAVWIGGTESSGTVTPTGTDGRFEFSGYLSVYVDGAGVDSVTEMTVSIAPTTRIIQNDNKDE